jgi:DNA polymerase I-like protein with 3'-5' exonuclease and polymerase domains
MNVLTSDFEITTWSTGNVFDQRNFPVCLGFKDNNDPSDCWFDELGTNSFKNYLTQPQWDLYVFFNAKYDLHWYRKLGVDVQSWKIWCCQLAEFILSGQTIRYPSLDDTATKYGLGHKVDVVKEQYWTKGINTNDIPQEVLSTYCKQDVDLTYAIYLKQLEQFEKNPALYTLFKLQCQDLLLLEEMEWNGLKYNEQLCIERGEELDKKIATINKELALVYPDIPINFNSGDQLSAFLYGGTVIEEYKEHVGF